MVLLMICNRSAAYLNKDTSDKAQAHLSWAAIERVGSGKEEFPVVLPKVYGDKVFTMLTESEVGAVFACYKASALSNGGGRKRKNKGKPDKRKSRTQARTMPIDVASRTDAAAGCHTDGDDSPKYVDNVTVAQQHQLQGPWVASRQCIRN